MAEGDKRPAVGANDTSLALDLMRALAAQVVCVFHAWNLFKLGPVSHAPYIGVMLFFILSGFVIAATLSSKLALPRYGLGSFVIDRTARIMTAFLPALALIALVDFVAVYAGLYSTDPRSLEVFAKNALLFINHPHWRLSTHTFGSAGQLSTVAVEFHIYVFVGAMCFLLAGRGRAVAFVVAALASATPLAYFSMEPGSDRSLFVLWLMGFAAYFMVRDMRVDRSQTIAALVCGVALVGAYLNGHSFERGYDMADYPGFALAFLAFIIAAKGSRYLMGRARLGAAVRAFAACSFSLYLTHYTLQKLVAAVWPGYAGLAVAVVGANLFAFAFAYLFERHYRKVARLGHAAVARARHLGGALLSKTPWLPMRATDA